MTFAGSGNILLNYLYIFRISTLLICCNCAIIRKAVER